MTDGRARPALFPRALAPLLGLLGACTMQMAGNRPETLTVDMPGSFPETYQLDRGQKQGPETLAPPENLAVGEAAGGLPPSGAWAGIGHATSDPMGGCDDTIRVTGFNVNGNQVNFGPFSGTIQPNGGLRMQQGPRYVIGKFKGPRFEGQFWRAGLACNYAVVLQPA
jgi:hypothetical protein